MARRPLICFTGPLPPPIHGMASVNAEMVELLREPVDVCATSVSRGNSGFLNGLPYKIGRSVVALWRIFAARLRGARVWYGSVDGRFGVLFTCMFAAAARLAGLRLYLHHHGFLFADSRSRIMACLAWIAGPEACHVLLCDGMARRFRENYRHIRHTIVVPNCVPLPAEVARGERQAAITIGLLSNLTFEKGVATFTQLLEAARAEGLDVRGVMAGPAVSRAVEGHIADARARLGPALEWRGLVLDDARETFFAEIDLFVFPTTYRIEAYPLVLMEALVRGVPVITLDRGCIGELANLEGCTVVSRAGDLAAAAMALLRDWQARPESIAATQAAARAQGRALNARNAERRAALVDELVAAARRVPVRTA